MTDAGEVADDPLARLTAEARTRGAPPLRPVDAATLILVDSSAAEPRVLMGRRNPGLRFMPGKFVFPGGRVDASDRRMPAHGALDALTMRRLLLRTTRPTGTRLKALALASLRETFEETGIAIGHPAGAVNVRAPEGIWREYSGSGVLPSLDELRLVARAITPPGRPRRFDTRFFTAPADRIAARVPRDIGPGAELVELVWVTLGDARRLDLPAITQVVLDELAARLAVDDAMRPVPFYYERRGRFVCDMLS